MADPISVSPDTSVGELLRITKENKISGVPVVEGSQVVGIVTHRDIRFENNLSQPVRNIMTPKEKLVTVKEEPEQRISNVCYTNTASKK
ncbi:MAG: CBS domain-containing protein [Moraxella sp.]